MFLKIKTEASGFPNDINPKEEKDKYVHKYRQHEGVYLDVQSICNNAGLRSIAKLALNSFHGKFCQKTNIVLMKTKGKVNLKSNNKMCPC